MQNNWETVAIEKLILAKLEKNLKSNIYIYLWIHLS